MELMISQKNQLLELIKVYELEPFNFQWIKMKSKFNDLVPALKYRDTSYYFSIDMSNDNFTCIYSPGENMIVELSIERSWQSAIYSFREWLNYLVREISQPDLWAELERVRQLDNIEFEAEDTMQQFTYQEIKQIQAGVEEIRSYLLDIRNEESKIINEKLDYIIESSERMGRKDWANIFYGAMVSLSITLVLDPQQGQTMINLFKSAVSGIIKFISANGI